MYKKVNAKKKNMGHQARNKNIGQYLGMIECQEHPIRGQNRYIHLQMMTKTCKLGILYHLSPEIG